MILLLEDFSKVFDSIHRGKTEPFFLVYGLLQAIILLYNNTTIKVCSPDEDSNFLDIVA